MAKKKSEPAAPKRERIMVALPEWHRGPLEALKKKNRRPTTSEVEIALEAHYKKEGVQSSPNTST